MRRKRLAGRPAAALPPDRDRGEPDRRRVYEGNPKPLFKQEGLSLRASLAMHMRNSAFRLRQENLIRQIREGFAADLIVLGRDLLRVPLLRESKAKVDLTMVDGRIVHRGLRAGVSLRHGTP